MVILRCFLFFFFEVVDLGRSFKNSQRVQLFYKGMWQEGWQEEWEWSSRVRLPFQGLCQQTGFHWDEHRCFLWNDNFQTCLFESLFCFPFLGGVRRLMMKTRLTHVDELISTVFPHQVHKIIHLNHVNKVPVKNLHWKAFQSGCS